MSRLIEAVSYAARKHVHQRRKGANAEPYVNHVIDVAERVSRSPLADEDVVIAALLVAVEPTTLPSTRYSMMAAPSLARSELALVTLRA